MYPQFPINTIEINPEHHLNIMQKQKNENLPCIAYQ